MKLYGEVNKSGIRPSGNSSCRKDALIFSSQLPDFQLNLINRISRGACLKQAEMMPVNPRAQALTEETGFD